MSVNRYKPHILVLPEDEANRDLANGFFLDPTFARSNCYQVLEEAGGWSKVLDCFVTDHASYMDRFPNRYMLLLIDFDSSPDARLEEARRRIPNHLRDRVFILGTRTEPEALRTALGQPCERIGLRLATDCREQTYALWRHELLNHNDGELQRLCRIVRPILFDQN